MQCVICTLLFSQKLTELLLYVIFIRISQVSILKQKKELHDHSI